jgi:hypothetical protein
MPSPLQKAWYERQAYGRFDACPERLNAPKVTPEPVFVDRSEHGAGHPHAVLMPLKSGGWARVTYTEWTWATSRGLRSPWTWSVPQQGEASEQVCGTREGIFVGLENEARRHGMTINARRV